MLSFSREEPTETYSSTPTVESVAPMQSVVSLAETKEKGTPLSMQNGHVYSMFPLSVILFHPMQAAMSLIEPMKAKARWWLTGNPWSLLME